MKTKSSLLPSIGVILALLVFAALPNSVLAERCNPAYEPQCSLEYGQGTLLYLELETECPTAATIFYTITYNTPNYDDPCHYANSATVCPPSVTGYTTYSAPNGSYVGVPYGQTVFINMLAWKLNMDDSGITKCEQHNPNL